MLMIDLEKYKDICDDCFNPTFKGIYITEEGKVVINIKIGDHKYYNVVVGDVSDYKNKFIGIR